MGDDEVRPALSELAQDDVGLVIPDVRDSLEIRAGGGRSRLRRPIALLVPAVVALLRGRREGDLLHIRRAERAGRVRGARTHEREHGDRDYGLRSR